MIKMEFALLACLLTLIGGCDKTADTDKSDDLPEQSIGAFSAYFIPLNTVNNLSRNCITDVPPADAKSFIHRNGTCVIIPPGRQGMIICPLDPYNEAVKSGWDTYSREECKNQPRIFPKPAPVPM